MPPVAVAGGDQGPWLGPFSFLPAAVPGARQQAGTSFGLNIFSLRRHDISR